MNKYFKHADSSSSDGGVQHRKKRKPRQKTKTSTAANHLNDVDDATQKQVQDTVVSEVVAEELEKGESEGDSVDSFGIKSHDSNGQKSDHSAHKSEASSGSSKGKLSWKSGSALSSTGYQASAEMTTASGDVYSVDGSEKQLPSRMTTESALGSTDDGTSLPLLQQSEHILEQLQEFLQEYEHIVDDEAEAQAGCREESVSQPTVTDAVTRDVIENPPLVMSRKGNSSASQFDSGFQSASTISRDYSLYDAHRSQLSNRSSSVKSSTGSGGDGGKSSSSRTPTDSAHSASAGSSNKSSSHASNSGSSSGEKVSASGSASDDNGMDTKSAKAHSDMDVSSGNDKKCGLAQTVYTAGRDAT